MPTDWRQRWNLGELQHSDEVPHEASMPPPAWPPNVILGEAVGPAFEVTTQDDADTHLLMLVAFILHRHRGQMCWRDGFGKAREAIAWYAFSKDASSAPVREGTKLDGTPRYVECWKWRDFAKRLYGASWRLPPRKDDRDEITKRMNQAGARLRQKAGGKVGAKPPATTTTTAIQGGLF